ncbi:MAG TPA: DCC1-like thiol-disulfide oxidoreductase family protein [Amycolatopsis sp.]|uniref:thiol-disulfide oxidoreductase DCC family protein n=1 Tax=Amycolatopsis sp. TaxID=37632 RepID=UPI002B4A0CE1|nr:DCC1-like thiol-disulfide oxidoreductase family protein [Amycolatopsis sp.]HKS47153.1 DCC1-like thiol-disulfide oxidoreductase family protein [Amycolatopsis sp.]
MTGLPLLIFDGDCGFCTRSVLYLFRHARPRAEAIRFQQLDLGCWGLTESRARYEVLWVDTDESVLGGARALFRLLRTGRPSWAATGRVLDTIPLRWLAHAAYRLIADNRHKLPGGTDSCAIRIAPP